MQFRQFLHDLHFAVEKVRPSDWDVDWENAPLPYKLYQGASAVNFPGGIPFSLCRLEQDPLIDMDCVGHFLWYVYGLTQCLETPELLGASPVTRRFVPSGGGLYPTELYVYLRIDGLDTGVYHYDVAHHQLVLLREGDVNPYLMSALGGRCDLTNSFGVVFLTTMFWKNFYKYHNFSYRLQGLDAGVVIGQLNEVAKRFGFSTATYYCFLDRMVNDLLGLAEEEESTYAILPLYRASGKVVEKRKEEDSWEIEKGIEQLQQLPPLQVEIRHSTRRKVEYPVLVAINKASMIESTSLFPQEKKEKVVRGQIEEREESDEPSILLPRVGHLSYDFTKVNRRRYSPGMDFILEKVDPEPFAQLCYEVAGSLGGRRGPEKLWEDTHQPLTLYVCLYGVKGIPDGAYYYDENRHGLKLVRSGDHRLPLQQGLTLHNVNLTQVPLCFHIVGEREYGRERLGERGYRIQQMKAGIIVQQLLLAASAVGWAGHPLLGFDAVLCDTLYDLSPLKKTCLIQIPIGPYRSRAQLVGILHG
ncbi:SagB-type dehydrogenase domain-containing protein [Marininema mesophilum]|uniref:SagB-type dehydrogenase domain-containing protein n=1 Tax=Marininema mesophilum TaxID=1048340 RepID=A0A1H2PZR7_9BACL|nr:SagB family peptide dehydrogenase [Marininema mesophilum]SDV99994.1 SagB-type dehydrogenase domain-containing protein [Marininema mesophilum]